MPGTREAWHWLLVFDVEVEILSHVSSLHAHAHIPMCTHTQIHAYTHVHVHTHPSPRRMKPLTFTKTARLMISFFQLQHSLKFYFSFSPSNRRHTTCDCHLVTPSSRQRQAVPAMPFVPRCQTLHMKVAARPCPRTVRLQTLYFMLCFILCSSAIRPIETGSSADFSDTFGSGVRL